MPKTEVFLFSRSELSLAYRERVAVLPVWQSRCVSRYGSSGWARSPRSARSGGHNRAACGGSAEGAPGGAGARPRSAEASARSSGPRAAVHAQRGVCRAGSARERGHSAGGASEAPARHASLNATECKKTGVSPQGGKEQIRQNAVRQL